MKVSEALKKRKSTRAFLSQPVEREKIFRILDAARFAASGTNAQPWEVSVVSGKTKQTLCRKLEEAFYGGATRKMEYQYYPSHWVEPYKGRRKACGLAMYSALGIAREDKERRIAQWAANYRAFDAPVVLMILMDGALETGSYLDCGIFIQSVMLASMEEGLATCPQASLGEFPSIIKQALGYPQTHKVICGIALGYEDKEAVVNSYRTAREQVSHFTHFFN